MKKMPVSEVWQYYDSKWTYMGQDNDGRAFLTTEKPETAETYWITNGGLLFLSHAIDFNTDDWTQTLRERPKEIKVGQFGRFWDEEGAAPCWGYLIEIAPTAKYPYYAEFDSEFKNFEPGLPPAEIEIKE